MGGVVPFTLEDLLLFMVTSVFDGELFIPLLFLLLAVGVGFGAGTGTGFGSFWGLDCDDLLLFLVGSDGFLFWSLLLPLLVCIIPDDADLDSLASRSICC